MSNTNKNILFYSIHPNDTNSKAFMTLLNKYPYNNIALIIIVYQKPHNLLKIGIYYA